MPRRILVVDDEPDIRRVLRAYLEKEGYAVGEAATGAEALRQILGPAGPDLVLLDIGLPDLDGLEVLRTLRRSSDVFVLLVTARAEEVDTLIGLSAGADDYIAKPLSPREVVARVRTVLRRSVGRTPPPPEDHAIRFPGLVIDTVRREVDRDGDPVHLSALEFDLLRELALHPGRVFSRGQLLDRVWGHDYFGDERAVDVHVRGLRRALADDATDPRVIGTVRGVGYKFLLAPDGGDR